MKVPGQTDSSSPWFQPGWKSFHCTLQPWTQPSQAGWPCPSGESSPPLVSPWVEPPSSPCAGVSGGTAACGAGHGSASSSGGRNTAASAAHYTKRTVTSVRSSLKLVQNSNAELVFMKVFILSNAIFPFGACASTKTKNVLYYSRMSCQPILPFWGTLTSGLANTAMTQCWTKNSYYGSLTYCYLLTRTYPGAGPGPHLCRWTSWRYASSWSRYPPVRHYPRWVWG